MPEGAEVARVAISLHEKISGYWIFDIKINEKSRYYKSIYPNPDISLSGYKSEHKYLPMPGYIDKMENVKFPIFISRIYPKGKKIIFECIDFKGKIINLVSLLAMTGRWQYTEGDHSGLELKLYKKDFDNGKSLFFDDPRHFGSFVICLSPEDLEETLKSVGPDLLNEDIPFHYYKEVLTQKRLAKKEICAFLLEQKYFSGVGNWVRAEVLYESKIAPNRKLESLSEVDMYLLYYYSIKVLREAYQVRGLTIANYIDPEGEYGTYEVKVYGREKDPFGNEVLRSTFSDKRTMHWVPNVQK
jgi:DNA-formamidopyrimidine glycosylase